MIRTMSDLESFTVDLYPITEKITEAMDMINYKMEELTVFSRQARGLEQQLKCIQSSKYSNVIKRLYIEHSIGDHSSDISEPMFTGLSHHLHHLVDLRIWVTRSYMTLVNVLRGLPTLENLYVNIMQDDENEYIDLIPVKIGKLKSLDIELACEIGDLYRTNNVLKFALQSCPLLETFKINGIHNDEDPGVLNLCFFYHDRVELNIIHLVGQRASKVKGGWITRICLKKNLTMSKIFIWILLGEVVMLHSIC